MPKTIVLKSDIIKGLQEVGLKTGDVVMVHSSLSSMGHVEGGADTVIDALLEVLGKTGTLVMPAFSFTWPPQGKEVFYPDKPSRMGKITETFRQRKGVLRSCHPTHSICAAGPLAEQLSLNSEHHVESSKSYFGDIIDHSGYILLLGVKQTSNTIIHYAESQVRSRVPYLREYWRGQGDMLPHNAFNGIEPYLAGQGCIKFGKIGNAQIRLMPAGKLVETVKDVLLNENPNAMLCNDPECKFCSWSKQQNHKEDK